MEDWMREFFFALIKLPLILCDWIYDIMITLFGLKLEDTQVFKDYQKVLFVYITLFVIIRLLILYGQHLLNEEELDIAEFMKRIFLVFMAVVGLPFMLSVLFVGSRSFNDISQSIVGNDVSMKPSALIVNSIAGAELKSDVNQMTNNGNEVTSVNDVDINLVGADGEYVYFKGWDGMFFGIIISVIILVLFGNIGVSFLMKFSLVLMNIIIAGYPIASLIDKKSTSFAIWIKGVAADLMTCAGIIFLLKFVFELLGIKEITNLNGIYQIAMLGGLLLAITGIESILTKMFGGTDTSGRAMQKLANFRQATRGLGTLIAGAGAVVGASAMGGLSAMSQKVGQALGGASMSNMSQMGLLASGASSGVGGASGSGVLNTGFQGGSNASSEAPTNTLDTGWNGSTQRSSGSPQNEASFTTGNDGRVRGSLEGDNGFMSMNSNQADRTSDTLESLGSQYTNKHEDRSSGSSENDGRMSRDGSFARKFADKVNTLEGGSRMLGNVAVNTSRSLYKMSASRYDQTAFRKVSRGVQNLAKDTQPSRNNENNRERL
ncbi:hypothetical protein [Erysipelothrix aquatica]|uniref:hypothetical protein n=1 Tax=Erysipelothrix aquatica TaxID=2683714 RepID=UPI0013584F6C|nr:hypothetical protein [Erysipelothrix aquatica]